MLSLVFELYKKLTSSHFIENIKMVILRSILVITICLSLFQDVNCDVPNWTASGNVKWSFGCDWHGHELKNVPSSGELCGPLCEQTSDCSHFTWTNYNGGTCWLKAGLGILFGNPHGFRTLRRTNDNSMVCGYLRSFYGIRDM